MQQLTLQLQRRTLLIGLWLRITWLICSWWVRVLVVGRYWGTTQYLSTGQSQASQLWMEVTRHSISMVQRSILPLGISFTRWAGNPASVLPLSQNQVAQLILPTGYILPCIVVSKIRGAVFISLL